MRYMVIVKANEDTEKGVLPTEQELAEMGAYNEELVKAGVMLAGEGLLPSSKGGLASGLRAGGGDMALLSSGERETHPLAATTTLGISRSLVCRQGSLRLCFWSAFPERFTQLAFQHFAGARQRERCVAELDRAWAP